MFWIEVGPKRHLFCKKNHYRFRAPEVKAISPSNWWGYRRKWKLSHFYTSSNLCHCQNLPNVGQTDRCYCCLVIFFVKPFPVLTFDLRKSADKKEGHSGWRIYWKTRVKVIFALFSAKWFHFPISSHFLCLLRKEQRDFFFPTRWSVINFL